MLPEEAPVPEQDLTPLQQLLKLCDQQVQPFVHTARLNKPCKAYCCIEPFSCTVTSRNHLNPSVKVVDCHVGNVRH